MVKIAVLQAEGKVGRIKETEQERYVRFYTASYKDNLQHATLVIATHPRWSIISGYYAMHDIAKLLISKVYRLKIEREVHATTIKVLRELVKDEEALQFIEEGYEEFMTLADELGDAKKDRVKVQYYTGTDFMKEKYRERAAGFNKTVVQPFVRRIKKLLGDENDNRPS
jgi:hypothetical protein